MHELFFFPPDRHAGLPVNLTLAGISYCDGSYRICRECDDICVLELVTSGEGTLIVNDTVCHPQKGDLYIVPPYSRHTYFSDKNNPWIKYWFNLNGKLMGKLLESYGLKDVFLVKNFTPRELFFEGWRRLNAEPQNHPAITAALVNEILTHAALIVRKQPAELNESALMGMRIRKILDADLCRPSPDLSVIAANLQLSRSRLLQIFKQEFGISPIHYFLQRKLEVACDLLSHSRLSVKEIGAQLGFADQYYFSALFKKKKGVSPKQYREE